MNWINKVKALLVICLSSLIAFAIVEYTYRFVMDSRFKDSYRNRTMLFQAGSNFARYENYFKYHPEISIRSLTLYSISNPQRLDDLVIEYDYVIQTNNAGLVMQSNLSNNDDVVFVIGDSFTEGQGSSPWFYTLEKSHDALPWKPVNLGILGTGPMQWVNLYKSVVDEYELSVKASVVNIIPADMNRDVWIFKDRELNCLYYVECNYSLGFQGYKFKRGEKSNDIKQSVLDDLSSLEIETNFKSIKEFIKQSRVIVAIYEFINSSLKSGFNNVVRLNEKAILALKEDVRDNFHVNIVAQKTINSTNFSQNEAASRLIKFLESNQISFSWCDISNNGFHINDSHPNAEGYEILRVCTEDAIRKVTYR